MFRLENWSVTSDDPYASPEMMKNYLSGEVYNHHTWPDGHRISTSSIVAADGRNITTKSGSVYQLGEIEPDYLKYLNDNNIPYDVTQPIKIRALDR